MAVRVVVRGRLVGQGVDRVRRGDDRLVQRLLRVGPRGKEASSASLAAAAAAADASSGRVADDTPSQTIATVAAEPSGRPTEDTANASSLRWWRSPRSLTAATAASSCSMWSRSRGWAWPQFSQ